MPDDQLEAHLQRLGLEHRVVELYTRLLQLGPADHQQLAEALGTPVAEVQERLGLLHDIGLVTDTGSDGGQAAPVDPTAGLQRLARARESELRAAEVAAVNAYRSFKRSVWQHNTPDDLVEVITAPHVANRVELEERAAEREVLRFDSPPYSTPSGPNEVEVANLRRGVTYRVVYARAAVWQPDYYSSNIQPCISAGEQARVLPSVPVKLSIYDGRLAMVSLSETGADLNRSMLLVRQSSLLDALHGLFETSWRAALPMHLGSKEPSTLRPIERRIIELLASGITDAGIAEILGISRRTLSRHIESLTTRAGVVSRFQLAVYACRHGWI
ncbi:helix-turn-helix domain-containing protein [Haloechinothrix sp. LS1_15]|uniref:helix-turn-helix transcriptional regulator n=1 Tax=Haloechinothrix sp. LS1_15 TaxID=2652248 RepID=UPI0029448FFE|nr:helix-turn-helix domain-containing protein [Haloechinothrix sp. LS1_15]MDV6014062.1 helix-turn-helix transcriptional regulator [Haloechinothrix sp. LS1_15]